MIKNDLVILYKSSSPLDYPILTPLVSFISLCVSFEDDLIHSFGNLTLTGIDHVSIMKSIVMKPTPKRGGQSDPKHASIHGNWTLPDPYIGSIGSKTSICKETHTRQWWTVSSYESYVNLRPSRKKASPFIASLSVIGIKFHYIQPYIREVGF